MQSDDRREAQLNENSSVERLDPNLFRPSNLPIPHAFNKPLSSSSCISIEGGGSENPPPHLPPPKKSSSATSSPIIVRRLSAASVASRSSQNRLSGGSFKGSRSTLKIVERKLSQGKNLDTSFSMILICYNIMAIDTNSS